VTIRRSVRSFAAVFSVVAVCIGLVAAPAAAAGRIRWVDDDGHAGPGSCSGPRSVTRHIQTAVDASGTGDTIVVCSGTYRGKVLIAGKNRLTVYGPSDLSAVVIPSQGVQPRSAAILIKNSSNVTIRRLRVAVPADSCKYFMSGIKGLNSSAITVTSNRIYGTGSDSRDCGLTAGVFMDNVVGATVSYNVFQDFVTSGAWMEYSVGTIAHNSVRFYHSHDTIGSTVGTVGILTQHGTVSVRNNTVRGALTGAPPSRWLAAGIATEDGTYRVSSNVVSRVGVGIDASGNQDSGGGTHSQISSNSLSVGRGVGVKLGTSTGVQVATNTISHFDGTGIAAAGSHGNVISDNVLQDVDDSGDTDCSDDSVGTGTAGTDNSWSNPQANGSNPAGICGPA
jgi:hypothetical protein